MNPGPSPQAQKPNIVFILCDNVGWGDFSCYGGNTPTPRIDKFASEGTYVGLSHVHPPERAHPAFDQTDPDISQSWMTPTTCVQRARGS